MSRRSGARGKSQGRKTRRKTERPDIPDQTVEIATLGAKGDGEGALADGTKVYVPLTIPGDCAEVRVTAKRGDGVAGDVIRYLEERPRRSADCAVFGTCGGCQVQHVLEDAYSAWKRHAVIRALARQGIETNIRPLVRVPFGQRRRATFKARMTASGCVLGFNAGMSERIVDIGTCPALLASFDGFISGLRQLIAELLGAGERADIALTYLPKTGAEIVIKSRVSLDLRHREVIAAFADAHDVARIGWDGDGGDVEPLVVRRDSVALFGGVEVALPWDCFLQPSLEGERFLQELVSEYLEGAKNVADLFSGIGTFSFPIAASGARVHAVDSEVRQAEAIERAAGRAGLGGKVTAAARDLCKSPFLSGELEPFDAVVFDPPRAGAKEQAEFLADSSVPMVAAVSCNPVTLARDLRLLLDGGYKLDRVIPLDQFPMTYHVEAVALLHR